MQRALMTCEKSLNDFQWLDGRLSPINRKGPVLRRQIQWFWINEIFAKDIFHFGCQRQIGRTTIVVLQSYSARPYHGRLAMCVHPTHSCCPRRAIALVRHQDWLFGKRLAKPRQHVVQQCLADRLKALEIETRSSDLPKMMRQMT